MEESNAKVEKNDESRDSDLVEATPETEDRPKDEKSTPSLQPEDEIIKKKYGGLLPKKPPLISKDHEHAFFDSADWALGKKNKGLLESLRPKLEPSPHQQVRTRSVYAPSDDKQDDHDSNDADMNIEENQGYTSDDNTIQGNNHSLANQNNQ